MRDAEAPHGLKARAGEPHGLAVLVAQALRQTNLSGLQEMLRALAGEVGCYGCILWELAPFSDLRGTQPAGSFFVLAQWFPDGQTCALSDLPLDSVTGDAVVTGVAQYTEDVNRYPRVYRRHSFLTRAGIRAFCALPLTFVDGRPGALNLYQRAGQLTMEALRKAEEMTAIVPILYSSIRDRISLELIRAVNQEVQLLSDETGKECVAALFDRICKLVDDTFLCAETSVFLEDRLKSPGVFSLAATTWKGPFRKPSYRASVEDGCTGWVLARRRSVRILDLRHYHRDQDAIQREYPDLTWKNSLEIQEGLSGREPDQEQPLSVMVAPIQAGAGLLGVIRCSVARVHTYFGARDVTLLELVAAQIGQCWSNVLSRRELEVENRSMQTLVQNIRKLNNFAYREMSRAQFDEAQVYDEAFRLTRAVLPWADNMDIQRYDPTTKEFFFHQVHGDSWSQGTETEIVARRSRRLPLAEVSNEVSKKPLEEGSATFPGMNVLRSPIRVEDEQTYGLLDLRVASGTVIPEYARQFMLLLGNQLGLYYYLAMILAQLRRSDAELNKHAAVQVRTFQDLAHQLRTPIIQAYARAQGILDLNDLDKETTTRLLGVRGLVGKAKRVIGSVSLFVALAEKKGLSPKRSRLTPESLLKMLKEAAQDQEVMIEPERRIRFSVLRAGFDTLRKTEIEADFNLLEQAISNVFDNAGKYSYANTTVEVYGGLTGSGRFHVSVANQGIRLRPVDARLCVERGWRSDEAEASTQEGSGIGLWIVDNIMRAHGGELLIEPTNDRGKTVVRLMFPVARKGAS